jgi:hypothetical protein
MTPDAPDGFVWDQPDAMRLRCEDCGDTVRAEVVDLHRC